MTSPWWLSNNFLWLIFDSFLLYQNLVFQTPQFQKYPQIRCQVEHCLPMERSQNRKFRTRTFECPLDWLHRNSWILWYLWTLRKLKIGNLLKFRLLKCEYCVNLLLFKRLVLAVKCLNHRHRSTLWLCFKPFRLHVLWPISLEVHWIWWNRV